MPPGLTVTPALLSLVYMRSIMCSEWRRSACKATPSSGLGYTWPGCGGRRHVVSNVVGSLAVVDVVTSSAMLLVPRLWWTSSCPQQCCWFPGCGGRRHVVSIVVGSLAVVDVVTSSAMLLVPRLWWTSSCRQHCCWFPSCGGCRHASIVVGSLAVVDVVTSLAMLLVS